MTTKYNANVIQDKVWYAGKKTKKYLGRTKKI